MSIETIMERESIDVWPMDGGAMVRETLNYPEMGMVSDYIEGFPNIAAAMQHAAVLATTKGVCCMIPPRAVLAGVPRSSLDGLI